MEVPSASCRSCSPPFSFSFQHTKDILLSSCFWAVCLFHSLFLEISSVVVCGAEVIAGLAKGGGSAGFEGSQGFGVFQKVGQVLAEFFQVSHAFYVHSDVAGQLSIDDVPMGGAYDIHFVVQEEVVHDVDGLEGAASSGGGYGGSDFMVEQAGVHIGYHGGAFQKGLHVGADVGGVGGGSQQDAVGFGHFGEYVLELVVVVDAVAFASAGPAGFAGFDDAASELDQFGVDAGFPAFFQYGV